MSIDAWISILGSKFQREEFLTMLGSAFFSACLDRSSSCHAWIEVLDGIDQRLDWNFREEFGIERSFRKESGIKRVS